MEIRIGKANLLSGVQKVQGVVEAKGAMPILSYLLISTDQDGVFIQATDLEVAFRGYYSANVVAEGQAVLNAKKLHDIVRELPDSEIHITQEENNWVTIKCQKSVFRLPGLAAEEFPVFPEYGEDSLIDFNAGALKEMIRKTSFAVSTDETRKGISGLLLELEKGNCSMVGTDGHRLVSIQRPLPEGTNSEEEKSEHLLPRKLVNELAKFIEDEDQTISFSIKDNFLAFTQGKQAIVSRAVDGKFPNYRQVIPKENELLISINKEDLSHAMKRVVLLADEHSKMVRLEVKSSQLLLNADTADQGAAKEEIAIDYKGNDVAIGLNGRYVLDILNVIEYENVVLKLKDKDHSCLIMTEKDPGFLSLVMPMRL
jgi:DNA polymerase III subunit beta